MNPLQLIKDGLLKRDLNIILEGYKNLTGESLDIPLPDTVKTGKFNNPIRLKKSPLETNNGRPNTFIDDLSLCVDELKLNKKIKKFKQTARTRKAVQKVEIVCSNCKKSYQVSPKAVPATNSADIGISYICPKCTRGIR